jgi:NAD(P)-dependent dehydrogenase (short-subunit alcohol dehydrogenase family)
MSAGECLNGDCLSIQGRVAVVIGGTSGIGRALALGFARRGADVVTAGRRRRELDQTAAAIEGMGRRTLRHPVDVRSRPSLDDLRDAVLAEFGSVDILVNAAGATFREPTVSVGEEKWSALLDTNLTGVLRACQSFYGALAANGRGRIINVASLGSFVAFHEVAAYCASKTALLSLTRSLACEWAERGISVNAIAPGVFPTELNEHLVSGTERGKELLMRTPMKRFGKPEELIGVAAMLASDAVSFMTGQCITVDGGFMASGVNA